MIAQLPSELLSLAIHLSRAGCCVLENISMPSAVRPG